MIDFYAGPAPREIKEVALLVEPSFDNRRMIIARHGHPITEAKSIHDLAAASWITTPVHMNAENEVNAMYAAAGLPLPDIAAQATSGMSIVTIVACSDLLAPLPMVWIDLINATG